MMTREDIISIFEKANVISERRFIPVDSNLGALYASREAIWTHTCKIRVTLIKKRDFATSVAVNQVIRHYPFLRIEEVGRCALLDPSNDVNYLDMITMQGFDVIEFAMFAERCLETLDILPDTL